MSATNNCGKADVSTALDVARSIGSDPDMVANPVLSACQLDHAAARPSALPLGPGKGGNASEPLLLRAAPDLPLRHQLIALAHGANSDVVDLRSIAGRRCVDRRSAPRTESLLALVAALSGLHIDGGLARQNAKAMVRR